MNLLRIFIDIVLLKSARSKYKTYNVINNRTIIVFQSIVAILIKCLEYEIRDYFKDDTHDNIMQLTRNFENKFYLPISFFPVVLHEKLCISTSRGF